MSEVRELLKRGAFKVILKEEIQDGTNTLTRQVYIKNPTPQFVLDLEECFDLLRPLYSLSDAGDLWHRTLNAHLIDDLGLTSTKSDPSFFFAGANNELDGLNGSYVDDLLRAGPLSFRKTCEKTHQKFETSGDDNPPFTFAGFRIDRRSDVPYAIDQVLYMKKLEELDRSSWFSGFRSMRMKLAWLANTFPDLQFEIPQLAQVTEKLFGEGERSHIPRLNAAIRYAHNNVAHLKFQSSNV